MLEDTMAIFITAKQLKFSGSFFILLDPVILVSQILRRPEVPRPRMALEEFYPCCPSAQPAQFSTGFLADDFLVRHRAQELSNPETAGIPRSISRRQDMVRPNDLLTRQQGFVKTSSKKKLTLSPYETHVLSPRNKAP